MIGLGLFFCLTIVGVLIYRGSGARMERHRQRAINRRLYQADAELQLEYRRARRDMNQAAGQSWRNLLDDGDA